MLDFLFMLIPGAAVAGAGFVAWLTATKGVPYVWSAAKAKWTAGATALATLRADIADAHGKVDAIEGKLVNELAEFERSHAGALAALKADVDKLKGQAAAPATPQAAAPGAAA